MEERDLGGKVTRFGKKGKGREEYATMKPLSLLSLFDTKWSGVKKVEGKFAIDLFTFRSCQCSTWLAYASLRS
jgi:hypothetical protein